VAIKISVTMEVGNDDQMARVLKAFRQALMHEIVAPKWTVKVVKEDKNEGIGDDMPLDLGVFGVADEAEPTPIEAYAERGEPHPFIRSINSLEQREGA
jgi:hypothetical protein